MPLGFLLAGPLAAEFGAVTIIIIGSAIALVALLAALLPRETRMLERLDEDEHLEALGEPQPGLPPTRTARLSRCPCTRDRSRRACATGA